MNAPLPGRPATTVSPRKPQQAAELRRILVEDVEFLLDMDQNPEMFWRRLGRPSPQAISKALLTEGRKDLHRRFNAGLPTHLKDSGASAGKRRPRERRERTEESEAA